MNNFLEFEKPIAELEGKIKELEHLAQDGEVRITEEVERLRNRASQLLRQTYSKLTPWQKTLVARHPDRPKFSDYVDGMIDDFTPLAGDRSYADDKAIIGGLGRFRGYSVMVIGTEKGKGTDGRLAHNFGMARPEGYRKAVRLLRLADQFGIPVVTLVDTAGAYPGIGAEERGQAEAIARSIEACLDVRVPVVSAIVGEGGSGGAVALAAANEVLMMEHAVYSVITPEGCASILWHSAEKAQEAATAMRLTAQNLAELKVIDGIVPEPLGGAQRDAAAAVKALANKLEEVLPPLLSLESGILRERRRQKFLEMGRMLDG